MALVHWLKRMDLYSKDNFVTTGNMAMGDSLTKTETLRLVYGNMANNQDLLSTQVGTGKYTRVTWKTYVSKELVI